MGILEFREVNCKNCYKCVRNCPVKSIEVIGHQARIIEQECILCGNCSVVCPQKAKSDISELNAVRRMITEGKRVYALIAPSIAAYFERPLEELSAVLKELGFCAAVEAAVGARLVKREYERLIARDPQSVWISSCCPAINAYICKHRAEAVPFLAPVRTPMQAASDIIKERDAEAVVVFIGPCIAKKGEAAADGSRTDFALTFDELEEWLEELRDSGRPVSGQYNGEEQTAGQSMSAKQEAAACRSPEAEGTAAAGKGAAAENAAHGPMLSRFFPVTGGILKTMEKQDGVTYLSMDGLETCMETVDEIIAGRLSGCFIEMSACRGSCIGGPSFRRRKLGLAGSYQRIAETAIACSAAAGLKNGSCSESGLLPADSRRPEKGKAAGTPSPDFTEELRGTLEMTYRAENSGAPVPTEAQITAILKKMGKNSPEDELNCGMCGYENCRKKAVAVFQNRAEISMCLPFMMERAESFSDQIINVTPNAILTVDMDLKVQQLNEAAGRLFGIRPEDVIGGPVSRILDEFDFVNMMINNIENVKKNAFLTEYNCYVEQVFLYDKSSSSIICIMKDISADKNRKNQAMKAKLAAADMADDIVEKQLRIVQEIASLLGETAAETKIAVADLKEAIMMDKDEL